MRILHLIKKRTVTKVAEILAARRELQRSRQVAHLPQWLDGDMHSGGEAGLIAADDGTTAPVSDRILVFVRDGERVVFFGTRK